MRKTSRKSQVKSHNLYSTKKLIPSHSPCLSSSGFTLIEVIVAITIIGIGLVMVMQLFSAGLRSARTSCDYTRAVVHAKDKMEELSDTLVGDSGEFEDGFRWEMEVQDYNPPILESSDAEESSYTLMKLIVKIYWPDVMQRQKAYELVSIKMNDTEDTL